MQNPTHNPSWTERVKNQKKVDGEPPTYIQPEPNPVLEPNVFVPDFLYIAKNPTKPDYGVFSKTRIEAGQLIEVAYAFPLHWRQRYQSEPAIFQYSHWAAACKCQKCVEDGPQGYIGTGFSSVYNCPNTPDEANASLFVNSANKTLLVSSIKTILPDEEVLIWFGESYYNKWCKYSKS
jgi:hypothetical protein